MHENSNVDKSVYTDLMNTIKKINSDYINIKKGTHYRKGIIINDTMKLIKNRRFRSFFLSARKWSQLRKIRKKHLSVSSGGSDLLESANYFSSEKIAIYTCVFGNYDEILNPVYIPDNCDFYIITDQTDIDESCYKTYDYSKFDLAGYDNIQKNRFFKMNPHLLFPEYKYSIYIDGNVQIISDPTEYINIINEYGFITHTHSNRKCVYEECEAILALKKENKQTIEAHKAYLTFNNMPSNYGMLECNILVREHHNTLCKKIMEEWWSEFNKNSRRDQLALPYVLYKNKIKICDIGLMGTNVYRNPSFRIISHR